MRGTLPVWLPDNFEIAASCDAWRDGAVVAGAGSPCLNLDFLSRGIWLGAEVLAALKLTAAGHRAAVVESHVEAYNDFVANDGSGGDVTQLLAQWGRGDSGALDAATRLVYAELRKIASSYLQRESSGHTLQPTALINEAYLRLVKDDGNRGSFENRRKFFAFAARLMRQVLVDHARSAAAEKRGGDIAMVSLDEHSVCAAPTTGNQFLALDEALEKLAHLSPRKAKVIELRYFGGLNVEETAKMLDVSSATISREQRMAEAWLSQAMAE